MSGHRHQRGVAVVTALLLTTLAVTIVASLFWQQQVQVRSIENQRLQLQKQWILRGALDWARLILREDAKFSIVDTLDEPWAVPLVETRLDQYVEKDESGSGGNNGSADATISGSIVDAQSRYNLRNLASNGIISAPNLKIFGRLLGAAGLDAALAQTVAQAIAASQPKAATAANAGTAGTAGTAASLASSTSAATAATAITGITGSAGALVADDTANLLERPLALVQIDDLLALPGFTPEVLDRIAPFIIILPRATPVNINTAPAEVLAAQIDGLSASGAAAMVAARKSSSFHSTADLTRFVPGLAASSSADLAVRTDFFLVNGKVNMQRAGLDVLALIERGNNTTRLIWIREN
ncbi:MAG: type II secretion system minor pseudopilin GspK [Janthinobacterium lividum]